MGVSYSLAQEEQWVQRALSGSSFRISLKLSKGYAQEVKEISALVR